MTEQKRSFDDLDAVKALVEALEKFNDEERKRIIKWACEKLGTSYTIGKIENKPDKLQVVNEQNIEKQEISKSNVDIKTFVDSKNPRNDAQFVAVVAYYYKFEAINEEQKDFIDGKSLNDAARLANRNRFPKAAATLNNVYSKSGFLDKMTKGKYKINTVGENLVVMVLPNKDESKQRKKRVVKKKKVNKKNKKK